MVNVLTEVSGNFWTSPWGGAIISIVVAVIATGILVPICTKVVSRKMTQYFDKKDKEKEEAEKEKLRLEKLEKEEADKKLVDTIDSVVQVHTDPIDNKLEDLEGKINKVADGTLDVLRDRILTVYYKNLAQGYRTEYDIANVEHMYKDYVALNGNSFVDECIEKWKKIPTEKEYEILHHQSHKKTRAKKGSTSKPKKEDKEG